jgi:phosphate/sulfate permease
VVSEHRILAIASRVATPLSVVSLLIIILYLLYKHVLSLPIFSKLDEAGTYQVVTQILFYLFILAIVGLIIGMVLYAMIRLRHYSRENQPLKTEAVGNGLKVVDIKVIENYEEIRSFRKTWFHERDKSIEKRGGFPLIDMKLRNLSGTPMFLKGIEFDISCREAVVDQTCYSALPASWEYSILFDPEKKQETKTLDISQVIKPNDVDRFVVIVGHKEEQVHFTHAIYEVSLTLLYNETESIMLGTYTINVCAPVWWASPHNVGIRKVH